MIEHLLRLVKVASVNHDGEADNFLEACQVDLAKLLPVGQDQERVGVLGRVVNVLRIAKFLRWRHRRPGVFHGGRIIGRNQGASIDEFPDYFDGGRLANVIGIALERESKRRQPFAAQGPQRRAHLVEEDLPLGFVDLAHLVQQLEVDPLLLRYPVKRSHILGKARPAIAQAGRKKAGADTAVHAHPGGNIHDVRVHALGQVGHGVDERDLQGQKGVGGMLDDLRALR